VKKKSIFYTILISLVILITSSNFAIKTKAHAPNSMSMGYSIATQTLSVLIFHDVTDPDNHYVDLVIISVNGSQVLSTPYTNQSSQAGGSYEYSITATNGSRIEVFARCVEGGSMTACIIVGVGGCPQNSGTPGIPGYFGVWLFIGFSIIVLLMVTYKKIRH